jgi:uncharacterized protein YcbX
MTAVGRVAVLYRHPVKSMQGESVDDAFVGPGGLDGDRRYALLDDESGLVVSAKRPKRWGQILYCAARTGADATEVALPDGHSFHIDDPALVPALSELFGRPVSIVDEAPAGVGFEEIWARDLKGGVDPYVDHHSAEVEGEEMIVGGTQMGASGNLFNFGSLHLVTTGTLGHLSELAPDSDFDPRRFRPNVVIDTDEVGFVENDWTGHRVRIGDVELHVSIPVPRCVMTTLPSSDLPLDRDVLRSITARNMIELEGEGVYPCVGVYADAGSTGRIAVGDPVELIA